MATEFVPKITLWYVVCQGQSHLRGGSRVPDQAKVDPRLRLCRRGLALLDDLQTLDKDES